MTSKSTQSSLINTVIHFLCPPVDWSSLNDWRATQSYIFNVCFAAAAIFFQRRACFEPTSVKMFLLLKKHFLYSHGLNHSWLHEEFHFCSGKELFSGCFCHDFCHGSYTPAFMKVKFSTSFLYTFMYVYSSRPQNKITFLQATHTASP